MEGVRTAHEDSTASELPFHFSGCPLIPGLSGNEAALLSSAKVAQAWEIYTFIQESALPESEENCTPTCSRSFMEMECSVFWLLLMSKRWNLFLEPFFRTLGTLDIVFAYVNTSVQHVRLAH